MITDYQSYLRQLDELMGRLDCAMLIGGTMPARGCDPGERLYENAALLYTRDALAGSTARGPNSPPFRLRLANWYGKMHLVPFSEYVPGRTSWPWAFGLLRQLVPSAMSQLEPGKRPVVFTVTQGAQSWTFASPICYEGVFARVCRDLATADRRKLGVLINISNDGWFIHQGEKGTTASAELDQHLAQYKFRAVENRVPVVRAVNCGISGSIDSNGRLVAVLQRQGQRRMVSGTMVAQVLVDGRISPYSLTGDIFAQVDALAGAAFIAFFWIQRKRKQ
jgi:apolipoprotein N-acyltransferase